MYIYLQVLDYYNKQWHNVRAEWVEGLKSEMMTLLTTTKYSSIVQFFNSLMFLTPYAFCFLKVELEKRSCVELQDEGTRYVVASGPRLLEVSATA